MADETPDNIAGSPEPEGTPAKPAPKPKAADGPVGPAVKAAPARERGANVAIKDVPPKPEKKDDGLRRTTEAEGDQNIWRYSRRGFLEKLGWLSIFSFLGVMLVGTLRFMFPRVLFEPSPIFKAGFPEEYLPGTVSTKWMRDFRVWIIRDEGRIYALSGICTHLGCTPRWLEKEDKFKCPCHGSGFYRSGINFEGPAPRALERLKVALAEDRQIIVDKSIKFLYESGGWDNPQSYLKV
ncbi:MAG: Rieske (2Fe-2S) protein [candidate division Zixibacteria bacterium]|nr:Rieske (2Fe-2S) protein [candidate division Zixibacteria bacterium]